VPDDASVDSSALPGWISADVITETRAVWQPFYQQPLTDDEIVALLLNVGNLFRLLSEEDDETRKEPSQKIRRANPR
jgi:hypothetical protein